MKCPKCKATSGNDWSQCGGECPMPDSPHFVLKNITPEALSAWAMVNGFKPWAHAYRHYRISTGNAGWAGSTVELVSFPFVDTDGHPKVMARLTPGDCTTMEKLFVTELVCTVKSPRGQSV